MEYHNLEENNCDNCIHNRTCKDRIKFNQLVMDFRSRSNANEMINGVASMNPGKNIVIMSYMKCRFYEKRGNQKDDSDKVDWTRTLPNENNHMVKVGENGLMSQAAIMAEANRIQSENVLKDQTSRFCCPPVEKDSFDISCGGPYSH